MVCGIDVRKKPFYLTEEEERWVQETLKTMTEKEKAGQLFCCMAVPGEEEKLEAMMAEYSIGGVLYRPVLTKKELAETFRRLDKASRYPLLKAANLEEGGSGAARDGIRFATQMGVAASGDSEDVTRFAMCCGAEGKEAGINWTFSPVADIDMNFRNPITNIRTFGSDADQVMKNTEEYVKTIQKAGIAACAKHFPGDGVDFRDQHLHPTCNSLPAEKWHETYGKVYQNLVEKGILSVMAAHITQPAISLEIRPELKEEDILPASLSRELLNGILREQMGFNGLIITDATIMNGYTMAMERERAIPSSIQAGCDMICFTPDLKEDVEYLLKGLQTGLLERKRLDEAVVRILALKAWTLRQRPDAPQKVPAGQWAAECADRAVTLVKDRRGILPVCREKYDRIRLICMGDDMTCGESLKGLMKQALEEAGFPVEIYDPMEDELTGTGALDRRLLTVYVCCMEAKSNNTAVHLYWCPKHALGTPRFPWEQDYVFVSFGNPYHLADVPRVPAYINAYTASRFTVEAVVRKLTGKSRFCGVSPSDPFCGLADTRL